ncbi:hypothetical protein K7X08_002814 [Anisodus acutangulus]|uniref:Uncharacterized protein n=1 Tax=Anisodus acutangulus TaxID=402998 RepID=A0A9Q1RHN2_9SOLA|nr:hypothetical protein K7X08_002814 [Anisodus acutangulus]
MTLFLRWRRYENDYYHLCILIHPPFHVSQIPAARSCPLVEVPLTGSYLVFCASQVARSTVKSLLTANARENTTFLAK